MSRQNLPVFFSRTAWADDSFPGLRSGTRWRGIPVTQVLLTALIITLGQAPPTGSRQPDATTLFECKFDERADSNFDQWPDVWTRRRGPGFPLYVGVKILDGEAPGDSRALGFELDGGGAGALSPAIPIDSAMAYVLEVWLKTEGLQYDRAYASITFLDAKHQPLQTVESERLGRSTPWTKVRLGPVTPRHTAARFAMIGLQLEPEIPERREDLRGQAAFADVWLGQMPRIVLTTGGASNLFTDPGQVEVTCSTSGLTEARPMLMFEIDDAMGRRLAQVERAVKPLPVPPPTEKAEKTEETKVVQGRASWKLPLPGAGFYRVRVRVQGHPSLDAQSLTVAVIEPLGSVSGSPFGWSLPRAQDPADMARLLPLLSQAGLGWIKLPLWYTPAQCGKALDPLVAFLEQLSGIEPIGVLDDPPEEVRKRLADLKLITAADVFASAPSTWSSALEPLISRLAGQVRWWQLGSDRDLSFVDYPGLPAKLQQTRIGLGRIGGDVNLGIPWGWQNELPATGTGTPPWQFLALTADPPLSAEELACYLDATRGGRLQRFVELEPLPPGRYPLETRATDLVQRMIAAKIHGADAVFVPEPINSERGLLANDGTATELFLPWRTAALMLGAANYLGALELPNGSTNHVFSRNDGAVMVAWNDKPGEEVLYLGDRVRQYDLWGRGSLPSSRAQGQVVPVGPLPVFLTGMNEPIARWRLQMALVSQRLKCIYGQPHEDSLRMNNTFVQAVNGRATFVAQEGISIEPRQFEFRLARGESFQRPFQIVLGPEATTGRHPLRIDFEVHADRPYQFAVYRSLEVGLGDLYIEARTRLNRRGNLVVEQEFVNTTSQKVTFRCQLFAPGRQLQTSDVIDLAAGRDARTYLLPKGEELIGRSLSIRAEEVNGPRVLIYRIAAER
jgi:hypothetical protein